MIKGRMLTLGMLALLVLSSFTFLGPGTVPASAQSAGTWTWTGAGSDPLASNPDNWDMGSVPVTGADVVFGSGPNCAWDMPLNLSSITLALEYSGVVSVTANGLEVGDVTIRSGTFTGSIYNRPITLWGSLERPGGSSGSFSWILRGNGVIHTPGIFWTPNGIINYGNYTITNGAVNYNIQFINYGKLIILDYLTHNPAGAAFLNYGSISGPGQISVSTSTGALVLGEIANPLSIILPNNAADVSKVLTAPLSPKSLTLTSNHLTSTLTLDLAGYTLDASTIALGPRTALLGSGADIYVLNWDSTAGGWVSDGSTIYLSDGGSIALGPGQSLDDVVVDGASWSVSGGEGLVNWTVSGLRDGYNYNIYANGEVLGRTTADGGQASFTSDLGGLISYELREIPVSPTLWPLLMLLIPILASLSIGWLFLTSHRGQPLSVNVVIGLVMAIVISFILLVAAISRLYG